MKIRKKPNRLVTASLAIITLILFIITRNNTPSISNVLKKESKSCKNLVHITVRDKSNLKNLRVAKKWKALNPNFKVILYNDDDMDIFVKTEYPEFYSTYKIVYEPVERADIWRYLILHSKGGVYADSDWIPQIPIDMWEDHINPNRKTDADVILGHENFHNRLYKGIQFIQWGMYSRCSGHPIFYETLKHIEHIVTDELITRKFKGQSTRRTGPSPFTWVVLKYLLAIRPTPAVLDDLDKNITVMLGDVLIAEWHLLDRGNTAVAKHMYRGSWKVKGWRTEMLKKEPIWEKNTRLKFEDRAKGIWNGTETL